MELALAESKALALVVLTVWVLLAQLVSMLPAT